MSVSQVTPRGRTVTGERRKHARVQVSGNHVVLIKSERQSDLLLLDISMSGLGVHSSEPVPLGVSEFLSFQLPGESKIIQVTVAAVFSTNGRTGFRIFDIDGRSSSILRRWLCAQESPSQSETPAVPLRDAPSRLTDASSVSDVELEQMLEKARAALRASGAAIAWKTGDVIACRVSSGNAPAVGVRVDIDKGLSGECYRTAAVTYCEDTETDLRVDRNVCRAGKICSILIMPLFSGTIMVGLMHLFFDQPRRFDSVQISELRSVLGDLAGAGDATLNVVAPPEPPFPPIAPVLSTGYSHVETSRVWDQAADGQVERQPLQLMQVPVAPTGKQGLIVGTSLAVLIIVGTLYFWLSTRSPTDVPAQQSQTVAAIPGHEPSTKPQDSKAAVPKSGSLQPVSTVYPSYPKEAWSNGVGGTVLLDVSVRPDGRVRHVKVLKGEGQLALAAIEAVKQWRYKRAITDGADRHTEVKINFRPQPPD